VIVYEVAVHFAYSVMDAVIGVEKLKAVVVPVSEHQPVNVYPVLVGGVAGVVAVELQVTIWLSTALPPLPLNFTVYIVIASFAPALVTGLPPPVEVTRQEYVPVSPVATALMDSEFVVVPVKCPPVKFPATFFH
jgi:hypothetical protein